MQVLFCGDIGFDVSLRVSHYPEPDEKIRALESQIAAGGVVANAAVACARQGVSAALLACVGDDAPGRHVLEMLTANGLDMSQVATASGPTAVAVSILANDGEKRLVFSSGVSLYPSRDQISRITLNGTGWVHTACFDMAAAALLASYVRNAGIKISIDLDPTTLTGERAILASILDDAEVVFVNNQSARIIGNLSDFASRHRVRTLIHTQGSHGAKLITEQFSAVVPAPSLNQQIVDTTGAGDCLAGVYIARLMTGLDPLSSLRAGVASATYSCGFFGAQSGYPVSELTDSLQWTLHRKVPGF